MKSKQKRLFQRLENLSTFNKSWIVNQRTSKKMTLTTQLSMPELATNSESNVSLKGIPFHLPGELITLIQTFLVNNEKQTSRFLNSDWNCNYYHAVTTIVISKRISSRVYVMDFLKLFKRLEYIRGNVDLQVEHVLQLKSNDLKHVDGMHVDSIGQLYEVIRKFPKYETVCVHNNIFRKGDQLETQLPVFLARFMRHTLRTLILTNVYFTHANLLYLFRECPNLSSLTLNSNLDMRFQDNFTERPESRPPLFDLSGILKNRVKKLVLTGKMFVSIDALVSQSPLSLEELFLQVNGQLVGEVISKIANNYHPNLRVVKLYGNDIPHDETMTSLFMAFYANCPKLEHLVITKVMKERECEGLISSCPLLSKIEVDGFENDKCLDICRNKIY